MKADCRKTTQFFYFLNCLSLNTEVNKITFQELMISLPIDINISMDMTQDKENTRVYICEADLLRFLF